VIGDLKRLHPVFRHAVDQILNDMRSKGWDPVIGSGMRTNAQQDALYAQGRQSLEQVNALRLRGKLPHRSVAENMHPVTDAKGGQSNHNLTDSLIAHGRSSMDVANGYAVDIIDRRFGWNIPHPQFWTVLGDCAKKYGCGWGGDWRKPDRAHVEMKLIDSAPRDAIVV
jgi:peptidoglycan L-alanyl-D-glutamate endopeptidase CwlK